MTRCEFSELETDQCAHCKGVSDPDIEGIDPVEDKVLDDKHDDTGKAFIAQFAGDCYLGGDRIAPGDMIIGHLKDPMKWSEGYKAYSHEECP